MYSGSASGGYLSNLDFSGKLTEISFNNYEVVLRPVSNGGTMFGDGKQYEEVLLDPDLGNVPKAGDLVVQILNAGDIYINNVKRIGMEPGELTAYSLAKVLTVSPEGRVAFGAAETDPFNIFTTAELAAGAVSRLYVQDGTANFSANNEADRTDLYEALRKNVDTVKDGIGWATFGRNDAEDGTGYVSASTTLYSYFYTEDWDGDTIPDVYELKSVGHLNLLASSLTPEVRFLDPDGQPPYSTDTSLETSARITNNPLFDESSRLSKDVSPWRLESHDPCFLRMTPEPAAFVALASLIAVALPLGWRKHRAK
jgi:hypothetical protein